MRVLLKRLRESVGDSAESGMTTAEYAIGTLAACAFAGVLIKVLTSPAVANLLTSIINKALSVAA